MNAILGGHIDLTDSNLTQKSKVQDGQLKFLAIATERRHSEIPDVPTLKELGVNVVYAVTRGLMAPKGTPGDILARLEEACRKATSEPKFGEDMTRQGTLVKFMDRKAYAEFADLVAGLIGLGGSVVLLLASRGLPRSPLVPIGLDYYPRLLFGAAALLSALLIVQSLVGRRAPVTARRPADYRPVVGTFTVFAAYVGLLPVVGFRTATLLFVLALRVLLERPRGWRGWARVLVVAVATTALTYLVFERYLAVLLPRGRRTGF